MSENSHVPWPAADGCEQHSPACSNGDEPPPEPDGGQSLANGAEQDGGTGSPSSTGLEHRGSPRQEDPGETLSKERWHSILGSSGALSIDEPEEELG